MILRIPNPDYNRTYWEGNIFYVAGVTEDNFMEMFSRLSKPMQRRLFARINKLLTK